MAMDPNSIDPRLLQFLAPMGAGMPFSLEMGNGSPGFDMGEHPMPAMLESGDVAYRETLPNHGLPAERSSAARIFADSLTAGTWPYMAAGLKKATGYDDGQSFDDLRRNEQREVERAKEHYQPWADIGELVAPFGFGIGVSALKPAQTMRGAAMRSGGAGAGYGAVHGYLSPIEPDFADAAERIPQAMQEALYGFGSGAVGRFIGDRGKQEFDAYFKRRADQREVQAVADRERADRRREAGQRGAETRRRNRELTAEYETEKAAEASAAVAKQKRLESRERPNLARQYEQEYDRAPANPSPNYKTNREVYQQDRADYIRQAVERGMDITAIARSLNVKPAIIARYIDHNSTFSWRVPRYRGVLKDTSRILKAEEAFKSRKLPKPKGE